MAESIKPDFVIREGLEVRGAQAVTSSTNNDGAAQFNGGVAVAKNLIVGTTATIYGDTTLRGLTTVTNFLRVQSTATFEQDIFSFGNLNVTGNINFSRLGVLGLLETGSLLVNSSSTFLGTSTFNSRVIISTSGSLTIEGSTLFNRALTASSSGEGSISVAGGIYVGDNIYVAGTQTSLVLTASNSIFTLGGVGISKDLLVGGDALIVGNLRVQGTQTIIDSTSTAIQDPVIDIGTGLANAPLGGADGLNKGFVIHYYDIGDDHMFLGRSNATGRFVIRHNIDPGVVNVPNANLTTQGSYSGLDIGDLKVWDSTPTTTTTTGALKVVGGIGVGESIYAGNNLNAANVTARNLISGRVVISTASGRLSNLASGINGQVLISDGTSAYWGSVSAGTTDNAVTSTNIRFGFEGAIPYQVAVGITGFNNNLYYNSGTNTLYSSNGIFSSLTNSAGTNSGALTVAGGAGIGKDLYIGGNLYVDQTATINNLVITNTLSGITLYSVNVQGSSTFNTIVINGLTTVGNLTGGDTTVTNLTVLGQTDLYNLSVSGAAGLNTLTANVGTITNFFSTDINTQYITVTGDANISNSLQVGGTSTFANVVTITTTTNSTGTDSGALVIAGGVGIGQDLYVGGNAYAGGNLLLTTASVNLYATKTIITAGTGTAVNTSTGEITIWSTSTLQSVTDYGSTTNNIIHLSNGTNSTSTTNGTLTVDGGVGITGNLNVGQTITVNGEIVVTTSTVNQYANQTTVYAGTDTAVNTTTGIITVWNTSTLETVTSRGSTSSHAIALTNQTSSTNTFTGALTVAGGVGIGGALYVAQDSYVNGAIVVTSATVNEYANKTIINAGIGISVNTNTGNITVTNIGVTSLTAGTDTVVTTSSGNVLVYNNSTLQSVTQRGNSTTEQLIILNLTSSTNTATGALTVSGGVGVGGALYAQELYDNGSRVITQQTLGNYGVSTITAGTDTAINTATGQVTIWNTSTLETVTGRGNTTPQSIVITNVSNSTSTTTGALVVSGGVGIGQNLVVGGSTTILGDLYVDGTQFIVNTNNIETGDKTITLSTASGTPLLASGSGIQIGPTPHYISWLYNGVDSWISSGGIVSTNTLTVLSTASSLSTTTGALIVSGGAAIGQELYIGGDGYSNGSIIVTSATVNLYATKTVIVAGTDTAVNTSTGNVTIWNTSTLESVTSRGSTTPSAVRITNLTDSTGTTTGALTVSGGVGIGGNLYVGNTSYIAGAEILTTATVNQFANQTFVNAGDGISVNTNTGNIIVTNVGVRQLNSGTDITLSDTTGNVTVNVVSTLQSVTDRGTTTTNSVHITNTASSTDTNTGALVVDGGIAAGGNVTVGERLNISQFFTMVYNTATQSVDFIFN